MFASPPPTTHHEHIMVARYFEARASKIDASIENRCFSPAFLVATDALFEHEAMRDLSRIQEQKTM
jgi:hypothetical protein